MRGNKTQRKYEVDDILPDMDRVEDGEDPLLTGLLHVSLVLVQEASDKMDHGAVIQEVPFLSLFLCVPSYLIMTADNASIK